VRTVALANQKGGVGKTTTAVHLGHGLSIAGARVALVDLDPQANASTALQSMGGTAEEMAEGPLAAFRELSPRFWLLPSPGLEGPVAQDAQPDTDGLVKIVKALEPEIDWLLVDCPPRMDRWGWTAMRLCREVLIPVQAEFFSMQGLSHMIATLDQARREHENHGQLLGVLLTMVDLGEPISIEIIQDLRENLGAGLLDAMIFRDPRLVEAASHGQSVFEYDVFSKGARAYAELTREVIHGRAAAR